MAMEIGLRAGPLQFASFSSNGVREQLQSCRVSRLSVKATNDSQNPAEGGNGGKRIWRRRSLKKDRKWERRERTPFLEEQVIRMRGGDQQMSVDLDRLMNQADNKYEFVLDIAAEATEYLVDDPDAFVSMQPMAKVISDRMNEAGFERIDGYDYDKYIRELEI
uniref:Uncharacterized protein n=1 Tax=Picea sitchensis TaxID=3332 RepID=A9NQ21_PICSI|nr:unknown [Picea sitchensis]